MNAALSPAIDDTAAFRAGAADVFSRTFSLDFSPRAILLPHTPDRRPGWQQDAENIRGDWAAVGECLWFAIDRVETENPGLLHDASPETH
ncbi:MAG: hypothetical protein IJS32_08360 [Kiritimatiellae bacterium]|nr:hypothetical protein [Kiritimatiellia bacterium]